ncbi:MAG: hypothetical protein KC516_00890 [Nanoarchaeota archaeon]|nr:hypothetical protein [Nanoarchaeota archaeon]
MINILNVPVEQLPGKIIFQSVILLICVFILTGLSKKVKINERTFVWGALILMVIFIVKNVIALISK